MLCPSICIVRPCGRIRHVGPTFRSCASRYMVWQQLLDQFAYGARIWLLQLAQIRPLAGRQACILAATDSRAWYLKGRVLVPLPIRSGGRDANVAEVDVINLSFW